MTLVLRTNDQEQLWTRVNSDDLVESFVNDSLKFITADDLKDIKKEFGIELDTEIIKNNLSDEVLKYIEDLAEYGATYMESYIQIEELEDGLYFDNYCDTFFNKEDIQSWDTDDFYWYHDGSNFVMDSVSEIKEVEAEEVALDDCGTYSILTFETEKGLFKIDSSRYQGSHDTVQDEYSNLIESI
jgi:hypothetical protein